MGTQAAHGDCFHTFFNPSKDLFFSTSSSVNLVGMQCSSVATDSLFFIYSLLLVQKEIGCRGGARQVPD